ncbi:hypothetical protein HZD82_22495, partial [Pantoea agglomerans]|nr:hypothetical protein [Pantoea agglomerans]
ANLTIPDSKLEVIAANNQRMIVTRPDANDSWLVLPFDAKQFKVS